MPNPERRARAIRLSRAQTRFKLVAAMRPGIPRGRSGSGVVRPVLTAIAFAGGATSLAVLPEGISTASAALFYVLAVTGASAISGARAGIATSVLSFFGLNFFFTEPFHTFDVAKPEDLAALAVFLVVSVIVGTLLSSTV